MKNKILLLFSVSLFASLLFISNNIYASGDHNGPGQEIVYPVELNPSTLPPPNLLTQTQQSHQRGQVPDPILKEKIMNTPLPPSQTGKNLFNFDGMMPNAPIYIWRSTNGPNQNGWVPADADIAHGSGKVVIVTNEQLHIYNATTFAQLSTSTLQTWFSNVGAMSSIFDPKVIYDPWSNRWVIMALGVSNTESYYYVSVSQTSDPSGSWWNWRLNAHVDGSTSTNLWADYPGLGFSYPTGGSGNAGAVVITSNQYNRSNPAIFQYGKIRILKTSELYTGSAVTWYDFWNWTDQNGDKAFTWQPARQLYSTSSCAHYLFNTKWYGSNVVTLWRIDNTTTNSPSLTRQATVNTTSYSIPPACPSLGGSGTVDAFDCRTQNVWYMNGHIYSAWVSAWNWGSGNRAIVHYVRINTGSNALTNEFRVGGTNDWFIHPSAAPEFKSPFTNGYAGISFCRGNSTIYPEACVIGYDGSSGSTYSSVQGTGYLGNGLQRYGDYSGIAPEATQNGVFWSVGMIAKSGTWGTGVFQFSFSPSGINPINSEIPKDFSLKQNYPNPFNPVTKIQFGLPRVGDVRLIVYDVLGKVVSETFQANLKAGNYEVNFDGSNLSSGVYIYKLISGDFVQSKKMILNK